MKRHAVLLLLGLGFLFSLSGFTHKIPAPSPVSQTVKNGQSQAAPPFQKGEVITYAIKNLGIKAGTATLSFQGLTQLDGRDVFLIVFKAEAMNFLDEETIFADVQTFYPVLIRRNLNIFGKKESIEEHYDAAQGHVRIVKEAAGKKQEQILKKKGPVDNIYCFIYRYRLTGDFRLGETVLIPLPTTNVKIELAKRTALKTAGKRFDSVYMKTNPKKYELWFDTGSQRIPLRINGSMGVSLTSITMSHYKK